MEIDELLEELFGPFEAEMQVKAMVASCFIRDGNDLLELFRMGWKSDRNNRSFRSKLFVTLRMAIECFLKGLVVIYSEKCEDPEDAYMAARNACHHLVDLLAQVERRCKWKRKYLKCDTGAIVAQIDKMKVGLRYEIDTSAAFSKESLSEQIKEEGPVSGTIGSDKWMWSLLAHTEYVGKKATDALRQKMLGHKAISGKNSEKHRVRIEQFMSKVRLR
jgi:hypothetical protein